MESIVSGVGVLDKSVSLVDLVAGGPLSLAELTSRSGLSRATAHRLAVALELHGLLRRIEDGRWALGLHLVALGRTATEQFPLASAAAPALAELRTETGESVQLYVREGDSRVCVAALESPHGLRTIVPVGAALPLEVGSAGRVLSGDVPRQGWCQSVGEREPGVASVSAPVEGDDGEVLAAISVSGPIDRLGKQPGRVHGGAVLAAASRVRAALRAG
ncbi:MAG: IclR family transcriptional regulator [Actinomycetota bacterium]|nr:IclR family transcriptional regulator [Actinomycetota bacterium]